MRVDISFKHLQKSPFIEDIIEKNIHKIERRLKLFKTDEAIHISFHLEKNPHRDEYFCWVNMYLPYKVIRAQCRKTSITIAINDAFNALTKQLDKFKHKLEASFRRPARRRVQREF